MTHTNLQNFKLFKNNKQRAQCGIIFHNQLGGGVASAAIQLPLGHR